MRRTAILATLAMTAGLTAGLTGPSTTAVAAVPTSPVVAGSAGAAEPARPVADDVRRRLGLGAGERLVVRDVMRDADGTVHTRYDRRYRGLPVLGGDLVVHRAPDGRVESVDWAGGSRRLSGLDDVTPAVSPRSVRASVRAWLPAGFAARPAIAEVGTARLAVDNHDAQPRLVWSVETETGDGLLARSRVDLVDAESGRHLRGWSLTQGAEAEGRGHTYYSGDVTLDTTRTTDGYTLRDQTRGGSSTWVSGRDGSTWIARDADNEWGDGRLGTRQTLLADLHHGVQVTWDFYRDTFHRRGIAGDGRGVRAVLADGHRNAYWQDRCRCLVVLAGGTGRPFAETAVIAHEITHGLTRRTAALEYWGESGALNESTSDIFGTLAEWYADNPADRGDYWLGELSEAGRRPPFLRRMDKPQADGRSVGCWDRGVGRLDVHYSSGIGNHFFYLAAEGTGAARFAGLRHVGQSCNGATFDGIGRARAGAVWYRALTRYMVSTTSYREARDATVRAARDLYGAGSRACAVVTKAWSAVDVPRLDWTCAGRAAYGANQVRNPGFEQGRTAWRGSWGGEGVVVLSRRWAHGGSRMAAFGGSAGRAEEQISQRLRVPDSRRATLRTWVQTLGEAARAPVQDVLRVEVVHDGGVTVLARLTNRDAEPSWQRYELDLRRWRGQWVRLRLHTVQTARERTVWVVDDVSVTRR